MLADLSIAICSSYYLLRILQSRFAFLRQNPGFLYFSDLFSKTERKGIENFVTPSNVIDAIHTYPLRQTRNHPPGLQRDLGENITGCFFLTFLIFIKFLGNIILNFTISKIEFTQKLFLIAGLVLPLWFWKLRLPWE